MPITPTYPGVYVEEIPSGVRTITGVATSITAFIGRALRGPTNDPVMINSFGDFERNFGGLHEKYPMSYAVRDFYLNGGSQALIVRLVHPNFATDEARDEAQKVFDTAKTVADAATGTDAEPVETLEDAKEKAKEVNDTIQNGDKSPAEKDAAKNVFEAVNGATKIEDVEKAAKDKLPEDPGDIPKAKAALRLPTIPAATNGQPATNGQSLVLEASHEGEWGNALRARVDYEGLESVDDRYSPLTEDDLFNLTIRDMNVGTTERFLSLAVKDGSRRADRVLKNDSDLVRVQGELPTRLPQETDAATTDAALDAAMNEAIAERTKAIDEDESIPNEEKLKLKEEATKEEKAKRVDKKEASKAEPFSKEDSTRSIEVLDADKAGADGQLQDTDITTGAGLQDEKAGLYALEKADLFNLLCIPPDTRDGDADKEVYKDAMAYCAKRRAMLIVDPPNDWTSASDITKDRNQKLTALGLSGPGARNAALYFPRVLKADPLREGQTDTFTPSGIIAGVMASTDVQRGVWKAPAGIDAALNGIQGLDVELTDDENGMLNPLGVNCLRSFPVTGSVVWGARTLRGADQFADDYKYVPIRRLALYLEESLFRGLKWVVFEPNDEPLWAQIRLNVGAFMQNHFRQGAFQGQSRREAYFVKCDKETTTQNDRNLGIVNVQVGFAPLKPAEFVMLKIQQMAGQIET